jgi:hypothetical protein
MPMLSLHPQNDLNILQKGARKKDEKCCSEHNLKNHSFPLASPNINMDDKYFISLLLKISWSLINCLEEILHLSSYDKCLYSQNLDRHLTLRLRGIQCPVHIALMVQKIIVSCCINCKFYSSISSALCFDDNAGKQWNAVE